MPRKFWLVTAILFGFICKSTWIFFFCRDPYRRAQRLLPHLQKHCCWILRVMQVNVSILGNAKLIESPGAYLVLANHSSYLDMIILGAYYPMLFISSVERRDDGIIGLLAKMAGTIFVDRIDRSKLHEDIGQISWFLERRIPLCIFPEGTTSNGREILPFKSSLLRAIEGKNVDVLPLCLRYTQLNGRAIQGQDWDTICWYGDMGFAPHFQKLTRQDSINAQLSILDPIASSVEMSRKHIASSAYQKITETYFK